jgi:hypothetical protein
MTLALMGSTVIVKGCEPGKCGHLLPADPAQFGHTHDDRHSGTLADAGHTQHQSEAAGEILVDAQLS